MEGHGLEWQRSKYSPVKQKVLKFMERFTAWLNQHLIMCSEGQVKYFKEEYGRDCVCIPGAVNLPDLDDPCESDILSRFDLESRKFFLFMGRIVQDKNPDYLIQAFMASRHEGYKLVVAGGNDAMPDYVGSLHTMARGCDDIVFTGPVYGNDKEQLLRNAYCFCLPSTIEGLSIVLMEAASYKLPVIASDIEANREFLDEAAVYVRPENKNDLIEAIEHAIAEPALMRGFVEINYKKILEKYTWNIVAKKYDAYLKQIAKINN
jgi:glycosyltransferase involved in cell wall biosynthesis